MKLTFRIIALLIVSLAFSASAKAQEATTHYIYDDNGRLVAVITSTGEASVYEYDAAGNFTAIRRLTANDLELFAFSPHEGVPGDLVTFTGVGFGAGVNAVLFNGAAARIVAVSPSTVVAEVPEGATTGTVTITTQRGSLTTPVPFTIRGVRVSPSAARLVSGASLQFAATVVLSGDQSVRWSVNGVEGGNAAVGTISTSGLYTAPNLSSTLPSAPSFVRATSVAVPELFGEAQVIVQNQEFIRVARSSEVSVRNGNISTSTFTSPLSMGVSVRNGNITTAKYLTISSAVYENAFRGGAEKP